MLVYSYWMPSDSLRSGSEPRTTVTGQQTPYAGSPENLSGQDAPIARAKAKPIMVWVNQAPIAWGIPNLEGLASEECRHRGKSRQVADRQHRHFVRKAP